ncbi:hypothetical protein C8F01DRAFT_1256792 [Mycena amicta]|nr:hypothetical protein C8F01DRAFT_1256792 [Mycena amicta]
MPFPLRSLRFRPLSCSPPHAFAPASSCNDDATNTGPLAPLPCADIIPNSLARWSDALGDGLAFWHLRRSINGMSFCRSTLDGCSEDSHPEDSYSEDWSTRIFAVLPFLEDAIDRRPELWVALAKQGIIPILVSLLRQLMNGDFQFAPLVDVRVADPHGMAARAASQLMHEGSIEPDRVNANSAMNIRGYLWRFLASYLGVPRRQETVVEALRAGLLLAYFDVSADVYADGYVLCFLRKVLLEHLDESLVFHSVLHQIRISLQEVRDFDPSAKLRWPGEELPAEWNAFIRRDQNQFKVVELYERGELTKFKVCDNTSCGSVQPKSDLKLCSDCLATSVRRVCPKDRAFLKALVNHEYNAQKEKLALDFLAVLKRAPGSLPCHARLQRRRVHTEILNTRSNPKSELHVLGLQSLWMRGNPEQLEEKVKRWLLMPLRFSSAQFNSALRSLARSSPALAADERFDPEVYREKVKALLDEYSCIIRTY